MRSLGTTLERNLSGTCKRDVLVTSYGEGGFDYVGNSFDDLPVWHSARQAYIVNPLPGVERATRHLGNVVQVVRSDAKRLGRLYKSLAHSSMGEKCPDFCPSACRASTGQSAVTVARVLAFVFFGLCASGVYVLNDLLDLADDRKHPANASDPLPVGLCRSDPGLVLFPWLLLVSFLGAWFGFLVSSSRYSPVITVLTLLYSLVLKRLMALDVIALALLIPCASLPVAPLSNWS